MVLVAFSLVVLGGSAYYMSQNKPVSYQPKASDSNQYVTGKLVKKGTVAFSPCKDTTTDYALIGTEVTDGACTPLSVQSSLADPLLGQKVTASGTVQNGTFYATELSKASK
jgi:hypothetical protein